MRTNLHVIEALRAYARYPCHKSNCGTVCLCGSCHARVALPEMEQRERTYRETMKRKIYLRSK